MQNIGKIRHTQANTHTQTHIRKHTHTRACASTHRESKAATRGGVAAHADRVAHSDPVAPSGGNPLPTGHTAGCTCYMKVCVCVCACVCACVCVYANARACVPTHLRLCVRMRLLLCVRIREPVDLGARINVVRGPKAPYGNQKQITLSCTYICTHRSMHTRTRTHIHTQTCACRSLARDSSAEGAALWGRHAGHLRGPLRNLMEGKGNEGSHENNTE